MLKEWPGLPSWFWPVCGLWELVAVGLLWADQAEISRTMLYIFFGGVFSSVTVLKSPTPKYMILPMPVLMTGVLAAMALHDKRPFSDPDMYAIIGGFAFGVALEQLGGSAGKGKKK
jgi:hypothetical protein